MPKLDPKIEREIEAERALYTSGNITDAEVTVAPDPGMIFRVRFEHAQLETLFPALRDDETAIQFIRQAALDEARRRTSSANTEAAS